MNDITPKEASEILSHYTDLGYGVVIEGEDTSKIKQALFLARKMLTMSDNIFANTLLSEINKKGLAFEKVLLLLDKADIK